MTSKRSDALTPEEQLDLGEPRTALSRYDHPKLQLFVIDMMDSPFFDRLDHYRGRFDYEGPAIRVRNQSELQDVIRETNMELQRDEMGKNGYIVYPKQHEDNPDVKELLDFMKKGGTIEEFAQQRGLDLEDSG